MIVLQRFFLPLLIAAAVLPAPAGAMQGGGRGGSVASGQRCPGCDSTARAGAVRRSMDSEIAGLTVSLAEHRILIEHLRSRLAEGSPDAPRSERERQELQSKLVLQRREMEKLEKALSALCGDAVAVRGYMGVNVTFSGTSVDSAGRMTYTYSYPVVSSVEPGSPAARAGIAPYDTIVAINKYDARGASLDRFVREPGQKLNVALGSVDGRREVTVTVAPKPPTFGGACLQYRNVIFESSGQSVVTVRPPGARAGSGNTVVGTLRTRSGTGPSGQGGTGAATGQRQPVRIDMSPDSMVQGVTFFVVPPGAGAGSLFMARGMTGAIVAGAEVALVNGGLKTVFAVDHGALVVNVAPRSPADQAGVISGDVITSAQGEPVTAIAVLQRAIQSAGARRSVTLGIVRARQPKTLTLRW